MVKMLGQCFWERIHRSRFGDYTGGARSCATDQRNRPVLLPPLGVDSFLKSMSVLEFGREALEPISKEIIALAETEKLTAHANSIRVRFES